MNLIKAVDAFEAKVLSIFEVLQDISRYLSTLVDIETSNSNSSNAVALVTDIDEHLEDITNDLADGKTLGETRVYTLNKICNSTLFFLGRLDLQLSSVLGTEYQTVLDKLEGKLTVLVENIITPVEITRKPRKDKVPT